jgi:RHS repeat-associated protein
MGTFTANIKEPFRASGALSGLNYGNGRRLVMGYNANRQQPVSMKVDRASNPSDKIIDYAYQYYDANGKNNNRIRQITDNMDPAYTTSYLYDDYNRLTNATSSAYTRFYSYDNWGNITDFSGVTHNFATNGSGAPATNRIISDGLGINYSYDAAGNMTQAGSASYSYDGAGRLKEVGTGGQNVYRYDGDGMRVKKAEGGSTVYYVRSSMMKNVAMEVTSSGVYRAYVYFGGKLIAQQSTDGQFYWLHTNHLGNSRAMTDVNGTLVYKGQFDPYGQTLLEWGNANLNAKKFTGYERDAATGLDYANARMYSSGRGRFMQPDPQGLRASNLAMPESLNRYNYVRNDPVNFVDPGGTCMIYAFRVGEYRYWDTLLCDSPEPILVTEWEPRPGQLGGRSFAQELIDYLKGLSTDCVNAFGGADKVAGWIKAIEDGKVTFHRWNSNAEIKDKDGNFNANGRTVYDYWVYAKSFFNQGLLDPDPRGVTVISSADPQATIWDAHKWNKIIVGPAYRGGITLLHEFLHWEVNGGHRTVADAQHLNLEAKGYDVSTEQKASDSINEFLQSNCRDKTRP